MGEDHVGGTHALVAARNVLSSKHARSGPGKPKRLVNVVNHLIHDDAAAHRFVAEPGLHGHGAGTLEAEDREIAQVARIHSAPKCLVLREKPHDVRGEENAVRVVRVLHHALRLDRRQSKRLLAQHVRAMIEGGMNVFRVRRSRRAHIDHVDGLEETFERVVDRHGRKLRGEFFRTLDTENVDVGAEGPPAAGVGTGNTSRSHDSHAGGRLRMESHSFILSRNTEPKV